MKIKCLLFFLLLGTLRASTNDPADDATLWKARQARWDEDRVTIALNAARLLVPEMPVNDVTNILGVPHGLVSRPGRTIMVYRIGENDFLHVTTTAERLLMGAESRHYSEDSGRLVGNTITGHVEKVESPDLVFADWGTTTNRYVFGRKRRGIGKQVELRIKGLHRDQLLELLGKPDKRDTKTGTDLYYFEFNSCMMIKFDKSDFVERVIHSGR